MRTVLAALLLVAAPAFAQNPLRDAARQDGSFAWKIRTDDVNVCCCDGRTFGRSNTIQYQEVLVRVSVEGGRIAKLRMLEPSCALDGTRLIDPVTPEASLDFLLEHLTDDERVVTAMAMHDHPRVVPELISLARNHSSTRVRREAIFWLGQRAGEKAAGELRRAVDEDPEDEVRERAVFAISQLPADRAVPLLTDLVKHHKRPIVRKRAMFWLAQTNDPRALEVIEEILGIR